MNGRTGDRFDVELVSIVAHDLKTPIAAVKGYVELMEHVGTLNEEQHRLSGRAMTALEHMEHLIASLLNMARIESGVPLELVECDLDKLIDESVELVRDIAAKRGITLHVSASERQLLVPGDKRLLKLVIDNLLSNAVKYNRDGGRIEVRIGMQHTVVRIDVQDTGFGIDLDDLPHVFERFYRCRNVKDRRISGSGLGLAIAESIIQMHGGHIWVESVPEHGSTFSFTLPASVQTTAVASPSRGRRRDFGAPGMETASESRDAVDDDTQESIDRPETDSRRDET